MGSYYYVEDKNEEFGFTPIPEDEYLQDIFRIVKKNGIKITDEIILKEIESLNKRRKKSVTLTKSKKNDNVDLLKSPVLAC